MLGFAGAIRAFSEGVFGEGKGNIVLDDVQCVGTESELANCIHSDFNVHNCQHREDAGVSCTSEWLAYTCTLILLLSGWNFNKANNVLFCIVHYTFIAYMYMYV